MLWKPDPARRGAAVLLAVLGATDWVDGWIARRYDQGSELGKILDPTADRVLLVAAAIALLGEGLPTGVNVILWIVLAREVLIAIATVALALAGARRIDVVWAGKAGTLAIMFALPMFLIADAAPSVQHAVRLHWVGASRSAGSSSGTSRRRSTCPRRAPRCAKAGRRNSSEVRSRS